MNGGALWLSIWGRFVEICPASHLAVPESAPVVGDGTCFLLPCTEAGVDLVKSKSTQHFSTFSTLYNKNCTNITMTVPKSSFLAVPQSHHKVSIKSKLEQLEKIPTHCSPDFDQG